MVGGTLFLMQKGQPEDLVDAVTEWTQYTVDAVYAVCSGCSRIVVYGGGDIVFDTKRSNQRMQWMQYAVRSGIVVYGCGDIVVDSKTSNQLIQCMQSHSGHSMQWMQYAVDTVE